MTLKDLISESNYKYEAAESKVFANISVLLKNNKKAIEDKFHREFNTNKDLEDFITFDSENEQDVYFLASLVK